MVGIEVSGSFGNCISYCKWLHWHFGFTKATVVTTQYTKKARGVEVVGNARRQDWIIISWGHLQLHRSMCLSHLSISWDFVEEERGHRTWQESGQLVILLPILAYAYLHSNFCLEIDLQQLQVAGKACFKAGFEVEKKVPCPELSPSQVMLSEGSLLGEKGIPHGPCLLTAADSSTAGMVPP